MNTIVHLTTAKGFVIEGTCHNPIQVLDPNGNEVWRRLDAVERGDHIVIHRGRRVFGAHLDLRHAVMAAQVRVFASKRQDAMRAVALPEEMTPDLAEFLGMLVAEGYMGERGAFNFTQKDVGIMDRYCELCASLFNVRPRIQYSSGSRVPSARLQNVALQAYLEAVGLPWSKSAHKLIPAAVQAAPEDCIRAFVSAVIGLEGHVARRSKGKVTFGLTMASEQLIQQLQVVLLNYGVVAMRTSRLAMATNGARIARLYWRLAVSGGRNIAILRDVVGVYEPRKQALLEGTFRDSTARDWIPNARARVGEIMREIQGHGFALKSTFSGSDHRMLRTFRSGRTGEVRELTYAFAEKLVSKLDALRVVGPASQWLRNKVEFNHAFDAVVAIESGHTQMNDVAMSVTHHVSSETGVWPTSRFHRDAQSGNEITGTGVS